MHILFTAAEGFKQFFTDSNCQSLFLLLTSCTIILIIFNRNNNNSQKIREEGKQKERMGTGEDKMMKVEKGEYGYVLEDVPHLTDYISDLPTFPNPLRFNPAYSVVKQYFVDVDDAVPQKVVVHKKSSRGVHFRRAGPRQKVYFDSDEVHACIVTCGGLCPGLNTVIREIVCALYNMYGVTKVLGIDGGYRGFYSKNTIPLTPKFVNDIHKRGGTIIGTSRGGHDTMKIVDSIQDRGINQVYIIGGDGTQRGATVIYEWGQR